MLMAERLAVSKTDTGQKSEGSRWTYCNSIKCYLYILLNLNV